MPDITKCKGKECPLKYKCYRFTVDADQYWQAYFSEEPYNKETNKCEHFYPNKYYEEEKKRI
jgi:hypothetical protein